MIYAEDTEPPLVITDLEWFARVLQDLQQKAPEEAGLELAYLQTGTKLWADRSMLKMGWKNVGKEKVGTLCLLFY